MMRITVKFNPLSILSTYMDCGVPQMELDINVLKKMCQQRLGLYKLLPSINLNDTLEDIIKEFDSESCFVDMFQDDAEYLRKIAIYIDRVSHFALRNCYAAKYAGFFVDREEKWLRIRFKHASSDHKDNFIKANIEYEKNAGDQYVIPFEAALYLLSNHTCDMYLGNALVEEENVHSVVYQDFKSKLLNLLKNEVKPNIGNFPPKFSKMLRELNLVVPVTYAKRRQIKLEEVEKLSVFFPLCVKTQYKYLKENHHALHSTRFALGIFFKEIGLSVEDTTKLFRDEFKERWTPKLEYYLKHIYGLVGSKLNYKAESCTRVIKKTVSCGQVNGCPYSIWPKEALIQRFEEEGFDKFKIHSIISSVEKRHFQEACGKFAGQCSPTDPAEYFKSCSENELLDIENICSNT